MFTSSLRHTLYVKYAHVHNKYLNKFGTQKIQKVHFVKYFNLATKLTTEPRLHSTTQQQNNSISKLQQKV